MVSDREVCLFLTLKCNQNCRYCHRFLGIDEVSFEDNKRIINKIAEDGIKNMTFTGGEPLLYPNIIELVKLAKEKGLKVKLITNGSVLANNPKMREIYNYLDSITFSIDSCDNEINEKLGRSYKHAENIKTVLESLKGKELNVNINTVVSRVNIEKLEELGQFLREYKINAWRIFKFIPLRETAKINEKEFEISKAEFRINKTLFTSFPNISKVEYREENDMESKYVLIMPNGNIVVTENKKDVTIGNILENSISELLRNRNIEKTQKAVRKIKTLIAYNDEIIRNEIVSAIKKLSYVEVVGVAKNGNDTYNKIVKLQPEMVFSSYNLSDMTGLDVIKKSKAQLDTKIPVFNFITDNITSEEFDQINNIAGNKMNAFIPELNKEQRIARVLKDYKEFI